MKTPLFLLAAFVAFFVLPVDFTVAFPSLFACGLAAMVISDYRHRRVSPLVVPLAIAVPRHHLRLAA